MVCDQTFFWLSLGVRVPLGNNTNIKLEVFEWSGLPDCTTVTMGLV